MKSGDNEEAAAPLGLERLVVRPCADDDGELWLEEETKDSVVGCGECGARARGHGRRRVQMRDLPPAGALVGMKR